MCSADMDMDKQFQAELLDVFQSYIRQRLERECNRFRGRLNEHLHELCVPEFCRRDGLVS